MADEENSEKKEEVTESAATTEPSATEATTASTESATPVEAESAKTTDTADSKMDDLKKSLSEELETGPTSEVPSTEAPAVSQASGAPVESPNSGAPVDEATSSQPATPQQEAAPKETKAEPKSEAASTEQAGEEPEKTSADSVTQGATTSPASPTQSEDLDMRNLSIDELDKIIASEDPNFFQEMTQLKKTIKVKEKDSQLSQRPIEVDLEFMAEAPEQESGARKSSFRIGELTGLLGSFGKIKETLSDTKKLVAVLKAALAWLKKKLPVLLQFVSHKIKNIVSWFQQRSKTQIFSLFGFIAIILAIVYFLKLNFSGQSWLQYENQLFLRSFEEVADSVIEYDAHEPLEAFDSPLRQPEFITLLDIMRVNLRRSSKSSSNPMAAFQLLVETTNQEAAVELKAKSILIKDVVARVFESMPYDEIITIEGKEKLKLVLRLEMSKSLTEGRVKQVHFKTLIYKR